MASYIKMFSEACVSHSVQGGGSQRPPSGQRSPQTEIPRYWHLVEATAAVRRHPTRMHSCFSVKFYRSQTKFAKVMFSLVSVCPWGGGVVSQHAPGRDGVCPSMHRAGGGLCPGVGSLPGGVCPGMSTRGYLGVPPPDQRSDTSPQILRNTVNKRAVRIPLECILVKWTFNCLLANVSSFSRSICSVVQFKQCVLILSSLPAKVCQSHSFTVRLHWG